MLSIILTTLWNVLLLCGSIPYPISQSGHETDITDHNQGSKPLPAVFLNGGTILVKAKRDADNFFSQYKSMLNSFQGSNSRLKHSAPLVQNAENNLTDTNGCRDIKLHKLREIMHSRNLIGYIVSNTDEHQNEYLNDVDKRRQFISGFTGSAGDILITHNNALLWTDGRYHLQAERELNLKCWTVMKSGYPHVLNVTQWIKANLNDGTKIGVFADTISYENYKKIWDALHTTHTPSLLNEDLVDQVWNFVDIHHKNNGDAKSAPIFELPLKFSGESWQSKVKRVRDVLPHSRTHANISFGMLIYQLDDIAWLLNLRGNDIPFNPVFFAYVGLTNTHINLYIKDVKVPTEIRTQYTEHCQNTSSTYCIKILPYNEANNFFTTNEFDRTYLLSGNSMCVYQSLLNKFNDTQLSNVINFLESAPTRSLKLVKNAIEIEGMKKAQHRDSAALIEAIAYLENQLENNQTLDEISFTTVLEKYRSKQENYAGLSFDPISAVGPNGAYVHYKSQQSTNRPITTTEMYLLDSGGQYLDGTTDVTRTFHFGTPRPIEQEVYTRVLMAAIDLAKTKFPYYVPTRSLDAITRASLWQLGMNYRHGTGHGIGAYLNVHEGIPLSVTTPKDFYLKHGMFLSDEPGYYKTNDFGVRLETIVMVKNVTTKYGGPYDGQYLGFDAATLVPFEPRLILYNLLNCDQLKWLERYNEDVIQYVKPIIAMQRDEKALKWLEERTQPIAQLQKCPN